MKMHPSSVYDTYKWRIGVKVVHEKESTENVLQSKKIIVFIPRSKILPCFNNREQRLFEINIRHEKVAFILQIA